MKTKLLLFLLILLGIGGSAFAQNNARMLSTPNAQTGTSYTFVAADTTRVVTFSNAGAVAVTLPNGATFGFGAGTMLSVVNLGAGTVTITCASCTINGAATLVLSQNQGADLYGGIGGSGVNYVALASPAGANIALQSGNNAFSGNNTFLNLNDILWVGAGTGSYNTVAAAVTAAGSVNKTIIAIRSTFAGTCPAATLASTNPNITIWDFSGTCNPSTPTTQYNGVTYNFSDGNVLSGQRCGFSASGFGTNSAILCGYFITAPFNFTGSGGTIDGISAECDLFGTLTGTQGVCTAAEHHSTVASTGGTVVNLTSVLAQNTGGTGSTTAITNSRNFWSKTPTFPTTLPTNAYGLVAEDMGALGSSRAFSIYGVGKILVGYSPISNGSFIWWEDNANTAHQVLGVDSTNLMDFQSPTASGTALEDNGGVIQALFNSSGMQFRTNSPYPFVAGGLDLGKTANPFGSLWLGTAATNNFRFQAAATAAARIVSIPDPLTNVNLAFNLTATSAAFATATTAATCVQNTTAVAGAATTMVAEASPVSTPGVGAVWSAFVSSAGNVTINECAVAASAGGSIAFNIRVHP